MKQALSLCLMIISMILISRPLTADPITETAPPFTTTSKTSPQQRIVCNTAELMTVLMPGTLKSNLTIILRPGIYLLPETISLSGVKNVTLQGWSDQPEDAILDGSALVSGDLIAIGKASGVTIANLSLRNAPEHLIHLTADQADQHKAQQDILFYNLRLYDAGASLIKADKQADNRSADVKVAWSIFDFGLIQPGKPDGNVRGIDVDNGSDWVIEHNLFVNIQKSNQQDKQTPESANAAIYMARNLTVESILHNDFLNCKTSVYLARAEAMNIKYDQSKGFLETNKTTAGTERPRLFPATLMADLGAAGPEDREKGKDEKGDGEEQNRNTNPINKPAYTPPDDKKDKDTSEKPKEKSAKEKQRDFMATMRARSKAAKEQANKNKSAAMSKNKKTYPENSHPVCPITGNPL